MAALRSAPTVIPRVSTAHVYEVHARIRGARCRAQKGQGIICLALRDERRGPGCTG